MNAPVDFITVCVRVNWFEFLFLALEVVKARATAMQKATESVDSGMMTTFLGPGNQMNYAMLTARKYCEARLGIEDPVCQVANYLYTECKVVAGHTQVCKLYICVTIVPTGSGKTGDHFPAR